MKLKKLLKVLAPNQAVRFVTVKGSLTHYDRVYHWCELHKPLFDSLSDFQVINVRCVHDELQLPDWQDYIEIKIQPIEEENDK